MDKKLPGDHPIREIWKLAKQSQTLEGLIELARNGDKQAAKDLLALFVYRQLTPDDLGRQRIHRKELLDYLAHCFKDILQGMPAAEALHLTTGKKARPKQSAKDRERQCLIGWQVAACMRDEGFSLEAAAEKIGNREGVSDSTAKKAYLTYMVVGTKK